MAEISMIHWRWRNAVLVILISVAHAVTTRFLAVYSSKNDPINSAKIILTTEVEELENVNHRAYV